MSRNFENKSREGELKISTSRFNYTRNTAPHAERDFAVTSISVTIRNQIALSIFARRRAVRAARLNSTFLRTKKSDGLIVSHL